MITGQEVSVGQSDTKTEVKELVVEPVILPLPIVEPPNGEIPMETGERPKPIADRSSASPKLRHKRKRMPAGAE